MDSRQIQQAFFSQLGDSQQFRGLFEHLPGVYFFVKDSESRLMAASSSILDRFGLTDESQIIGSTDHDYFPVHVADSFVRDDRLVLTTGVPIINRVEIWYNAQRLLDWFVTNKLPLRDSGGNIIGVMGTLRSYEGSKKSMLPYSQISDVVDFIREHHRGKITVAQVAQQANVSTRQLHRRFMDVFGMSALEFLTRTRIQAASDELLQTTRTISEIALEFGFCDQSAFTRQFKNQVGQTPLKFRRQYEK